MAKRLGMQRGQVLIPVLGLFVVLILALTISIDFGRFLLLRSRLRTIADTAALAGAGALDIQQSSMGNFSLNAVWANARINNVVQQTIARNAKESWMSIRLQNVSVQGRVVTVSVSGSCPSVWAGIVGIGSFSTEVSSSARAAVGITREH